MWISAGDALFPFRPAATLTHPEYGLRKGMSASKSNLRVAAATGEARHQALIKLKPTAKRNGDRVVPGAQQDTIHHQP
jgi:hypothetical protein